MISISNSQTFCSWLVIFHLRRPLAFLSLNLYDTPGLAPRMRARRLSSKLLKDGYLVERLKSSFRKFYVRYGNLIQQYEVSLSRVLMTLWPLTNSDFLTDQTFHQFHDLDTELDLHRIISSFHETFATGVTSQLGTLTFPDSWFRPPFWDLLVLPLLKPDFPNLLCLYSAFNFEYPLVLSRFSFKQKSSPKSFIYKHNEFS